MAFFILRMWTIDLIFPKQLVISQQIDWSSHLSSIYFKHYIIYRIIDSYIFRYACYKMLSYNFWGSRIWATWQGCSDFGVLGGCRQHVGQVVVIWRLSCARRLASKLTHMAVGRKCQYTDLSRKPVTFQLTFHRVSEIFRQKLWSFS